MVETLYDVLGVDADAEEAEITDAYRERIKETHPDVSDAEDAQERSKKVIEAKEVLTDDDERARYDRLGHRKYVLQTATDATWSTDSDSARIRATDKGSDAGETATGRHSEGIDWSDESADSTWSGRGEWRRDGASGSRRQRSTQHDPGSDAASTRGADSSNGVGGPASGSRATTSSNVGGPVGWATGSRHAVHDERGRTELRRSRLFPPTQSVVLLVSTFVCYPALVFSSVFPPFPLVVNLVVAVCTLLLIAYLTSMPEVGVYVFGGWTVIGTIGVLATALDPFSLAGLLVLGSTWFPLGLTVLTYEVLRW